ncbi:uncharacterized protein LOC100881522 [Megachile rotundata]|uniref:uncharacterized protein LOC100881522 n=1 Tax=Megachile rotundata TaxID=143995 RepID=UPI000614C473|nr:PREDICTED: uncharacterized protein LOC100881522 isoform X2 [Megachile rotundata]
MSDHHSGKGYTPLPQSISNTDTEDEEDCLAQTNEIPKDNVDDTMPQSTTIHENGAYYPLDETRNLANRAKNGQNILKYYRDDMPIMVVEGGDLWKKRDMSPLRRFCLIASVLLCIATIIVFLYVLPCDNSMVCPSINEPQPFISWDKTLQGKELTGPISIIRGNPTNLIFLVRGQRYKGNDTNDSQGQISTEGEGVMSMQGNSGLPLWFVSLKRSPTEIDCITVDTDKSGKPDCIVAGDQGLLASIEPIAGTIHWSSKIHTFEKLPLILSDIDSDGVEDFLSVEVASKKMPNLVLLSGRTGHLLGQYSPENCSLIDLYSHIFNNTISYICYNNNKKSVVKTMTVKGLLHAIKLPEAHKQSITKLSVTIRTFKTLNIDNEKYNWTLTPYHYLSIKNEGTCPGEFCKARVNLTLQKLGNQPITIWDYISPNSFVSKPDFLVMSGKPYTSGFSIKFWQWINSMPEHTRKVSVVTERRLIERVLIVFVNYTDVQVMNASQSDIIQLCQDTDCQPDLNSRVHFSSIKIDNISEDGFPELITYWSSYDIESLKVLTSKVQVVKLDSFLTSFPHMGV